MSPSRLLRMRPSPVLARLALLCLGAVAALGANETGGLEFRGVVQEGEVWLVNVHRTATNTSQWIPVGSEADGVLVRNYDETATQLTVVQKGRTLVLPLKRYRVSLSGPTAPLKLLTPAEQAAAGDLPNMPDYLRELPPEARKLLSEVHRRPAIRWPETPGTAKPKPQ